MKTIQLKVQMQPALRKADGAVSLRFVTAEEINTDSFALIDSWRQQNGWLMFRTNEFKDSDIPTDDADVDDKRTLAEIQKRSLYKLFMLQGGKPSDFHTFYREQMNLFNEVIGDKIERLENASDTGSRS